jgi:hypothetical protein
MGERELAERDCGAADRATGKRSGQEALQIRRFFRGDPGFPDGLEAARETG